MSRLNKKYKGVWHSVLASMYGKNFFCVCVVGHNSIYFTLLYFNNFTANKYIHITYKLIEVTKHSFSGAKVYLTVTIIPNVWIYKYTGMCFDPTFLCMYVLNSAFVILNSPFISIKVELIVA